MPKRSPNVVLITIDALRADHLGFMGYSKNTSPFLDSLAKRGVVFRHAFSTGAGSPQSFVSILTSTYAMDFGGFSYIDRPRKMVSEVLRHAGYRTIAVHSAAYLSGYFGYDRGWDRFLYLSHFKGGNTMAGIRADTLKAKILRKISSLHQRFKKIHPWLNRVALIVEHAILLARKITRDIVRFQPPFYTAEEINRELGQAIQGHIQEPLFLWVHYMDAHEPFALFSRRGHGMVAKIKYHLADLFLFLFGDVPFMNRFFVRLYRDLYDISIRYIDTHIKNLFAHLTAAGIITSDTVVVVTADHGEAFFDHGVFGHPQKPFREHFHVPLLVYGPGIISPASHDRPVSLLDISPTLLAFAGLKKPPAFRGTSLFNEAKRDVVSQIIECEGDLSHQEFLGAAIIHGGYRFIDMKGGEMLYALTDMEEKENLIARGKAIAEQLKHRLKRYTPQ